MRTPSRGAALSIAARRCSSSVSRRGRHNQPSCDDHHSGQSYGDGSLADGDARRLEDPPVFDMRRREFITLLGAAAAWPLAAHAQQTAKRPIVGFLGDSTPLAESERAAAFGRRLHDLGWIEGRTIAIEYRWADGRSERLAEIAAEFARLKVDIIVTGGTPAVMAAKQAAPIVPIVFAAVGDPVGIGFVASLARPGGNVTGLSALTADLAGKRLDLLREAISNLGRLAIMGN